MTPSQTFVPRVMFYIPPWHENGDAGSWPLAELRRCPGRSQEPRPGIYGGQCSDFYVCLLAGNRPAGTKKESVMSRPAIRRAAAAAAAVLAALFTVLTVQVTPAVAAQPE